MTKSRRREDESRPVSDDESEESEDKEKEKAVAASEGRRSMQVPATSQRG
jgi:choline-phosphate cytidylyltransferase